MAIHGTLFHDFRERETTEPFSLQNKKLLRVDMRHGEVWARAGSMVAYQGQISFANKGSGGMSRLFKQAITGEGVPLMQCVGQGDLFLADGASDIQVMYLDNDTVSVNGANVLAFSNTIQWDIHRVQARGAALSGNLYNVSLRGSGFVAITTKGEPVALDVASAPTFGDAQAVVLWTGGVRMDVRIDTGGLGSMLRGGSGETFQMAFSGQGFVLVQPCETVVGEAGGGGAAGLLGDLLE